MTNLPDLEPAALEAAIEAYDSFGGGPDTYLVKQVIRAWVSRYGNVESIRYALAGYLETYDYLLSDAITSKEAARRLRLMRSVRRTALEDKP